MPATKVIKPKPVETTRKNTEKTGAERELKAPVVRKSRAASCPRCPQRGGCDGAAKTRSRSRSSAPRPAATRTTTNPDHRKATSCVKLAAVSCPVHREPKYESQSHKAFTVIPPNPKKRREMQRKAEAELAALEELRLSRAMAYVSINPSSVGGCMSLEEVRLKQQQEMMQARRKQQQVKKQVIQEASVLTS
ncbi:hypothetical protein PAMP_010888 [Pampus punctatissimus]